MVSGWVYELDDKELTAGIYTGHADGQEILTLPTEIMVDGIAYTVTSIELGAFDSENSIKELIIPDTYEFVERYAFENCNNLRRVKIGTGLENFPYWGFPGCPIEDVTVDPDNPYIRVTNDGVIMLTLEEESVLRAVIKDVPELTVPEGVTTIGICAVSCHKKLKTLRLPSTLKTILCNGIFNNESLEELIVPEGVRKAGKHSLCLNKSLKLIDLPSTLDKIGIEAIAYNNNLQTLILRSHAVVSFPEAKYYHRHSVLADELIGELRQTTTHDGLPVDSCRLLVPSHLIQKYKSHPYWGKFKHIEPINDER